MITVGGCLAKVSRRYSPPRMPTSSSFTICTTCCAGFRARFTSAPSARSRIVFVKRLTTSRLTSASSSARRISRTVPSTSEAVRRPLPRRFASASVRRSESEPKVAIGPAVYGGRVRTAGGGRVGGDAYGGPVSATRRIEWQGVDDPSRRDAALVRLEDDRLLAAGGSVTDRWTSAWSLDTGADWVTRRLLVHTQGPGWWRSLRLPRHDDSSWSATTGGDGGTDLADPGLSDPHVLAGALDCDLGLCPLTNTM